VTAILPFPVINNSVQMQCTSIRLHVAKLFNSLPGEIDKAKIEYIRYMAKAALDVIENEAAVVPLYCWDENWPIKGPFLLDKLHLSRWSAVRVLEIVSEEVHCLSGQIFFPGDEPNLVPVTLPLDLLNKYGAKELLPGDFFELGIYTKHPLGRAKVHTRDKL